MTQELIPFPSKISLDNSGEVWKHLTRPEGEELKKDLGLKLEKGGNR
jgi:hypothetical protein